MSKPECPEKALGTEGQPTTNSTYIWPEANANAKAKANSKTQGPKPRPSSRPSSRPKQSKRPYNCAESDGYQRLNFLNSTKF